MSFSNPKEDVEEREQRDRVCRPPNSHKALLYLFLALSRLEALRGLNITPGASGIKKGHWRFLNMDQKAVKCVLKKKILALNHDFLPGSSPH